MPRTGPRLRARKEMVRRRHQLPCGHIVVRDGRSRPTACDQCDPPSRPEPHDYEFARDPDLLQELVQVLLDGRAEACRGIYRYSTGKRKGAAG